MRALLTAVAALAIAGVAGLAMGGVGPIIVPGTASGSYNLDGGTLWCTGESSDAAADDIGAIGCHAWSGAVTNTTGGDFDLAAGSGTKNATVATYSNCATDTFTVTINGTANVLTEGTGWNRGSSNTDACTSLAAAVDALTGVRGTCASTVVRVQLGDSATDFAYKSLSVATSDATCLTVVNGTDGVVRFWHRLEAQATNGPALVNATSSDTVPGFVPRRGDTGDGFSGNGPSLYMIVDSVQRVEVFTTGVTLGATVDLNARGGIKDDVTNAPFDIEDKMAFPVSTIAADDTSPDMNASNIYVTSANVGATAITTLDNESAGQVITICGGSNTNSTTIADSGQFNLTGPMTFSLDDCLTLLVQADNDYLELSRSDN